MDAYLTDPKRWKREKRHLLDRADMTEFAAREPVLAALADALTGQRQRANANAASQEPGLTPAAAAKRLRSVSTTSIDIFGSAKNPCCMFISTAPMEFGEVVRVIPGRNGFESLIVCEHASNRIPRDRQGPGLDEEALNSHIAWDPGAPDVAQDMSRRMEAPPVLGAVSRLECDRNRPSESPSAMATRSEIHEIPGYRNLSRKAGLERSDAVFNPFHETLAGLAKAGASTLSLLATARGFAPVFHDRPRDVATGMVHGKDDRLARAMIDVIPEGISFETRLNEPYSAAEGVAYTIDRHGAASGLFNVMIEIRSDLIRAIRRKLDMADRLVAWIRRARAGFGRDGIA